MDVTRNIIEVANEVMVKNAEQRKTCTLHNMPCAINPNNCHRCYYRTAKKLTN